MGFVRSLDVVRIALLVTMAGVLKFHVGCNGEPMFSCDTRTIPNAVQVYPFCNSHLPIQERVNDLIGRLTLQVKVQFLVDKAGAVPRLGIPSYEWWSEALHGVSNGGPGTRFANPIPAATSFPQVILTAASFDTALWEANGKACIYTIQSYNVKDPMVDLHAIHVSAVHTSSFGISNSH